MGVSTRNKVTEPANVRPVRKYATTSRNRQESRKLYLNLSARRNSFTLTICPKNPVQNPRKMSHLSFHASKTFPNTNLLCLGHLCSGQLKLQPIARSTNSADRKSTRLNSSHITISYAV